jgi:hypothetical protein
MCVDHYKNKKNELHEAQQHNQESSFPSIHKIVSNFAYAAKSELKSIATGKENLDAEEIKKRYSICEGCEFFHTPSKRCKKCGCYLKWKTAWRSQKCPIGKW